MQPADRTYPITKPLEPKRSKCFVFDGLIWTLLLVDTVVSRLEVKLILFCQRGAMMRRAVIILSAASGT